jgi:hypothetical protein
MSKILSLLGESAGAIVPGLFSVGSWFVSQFFDVPFNAGIFRAGAILGMLAGYALGNVCWGGTAPKRGLIALTIVVALVVGVVAMVWYHFFVGGGHVVNSWQTLLAVALLTLVFACAGYMMPIAGIKFAKLEDAESPEETEDGATGGEKGAGRRPSE